MKVINNILASLLNQSEGSTALKSNTSMTLRTSTSRFAMQLSATLSKFAPISSWEVMPGADRLSSPEKKIYKL